ncbi:hypothetical protein [Kribbella sp. CA-294648]
MQAGLGDVGLQVGWRLPAGTSAVADGAGGGKNRGGLLVVGVP